MRRTKNIASGYARLQFLTFKKGEGEEMSDEKTREAGGGAKQKRRNIKEDKSNNSNKSKNQTVAANTTKAAIHRDELHQKDTTHKMALRCTSLTVLGAWHP